MTSKSPSLGSGTRVDKRRLKILHVAECYEAGVGHAVDTIVRILDDASHVLLYAGTQNPAPHFSATKELRRTSLKRIIDVWETVRRYNPDIIHLHSSWAGLYGRIVGQGRPVVYQPHCYKFDDPSLPGLKRRVFRLAEKWLGKRSHVVIALSPHEARLAKEVNPAATCVVLPNVPVVDLLSSPRPHRADPPKRVVMVGRVSHQKDPSFYIEIAAIVRASLREVQFIWAGEGDELLKTALNDAGVTVTGWLDTSALTTLFDSASCYVHTAAYEGFPLSILDAAARRVPIVARQIAALEGSGLLQGVDAAAVAQHVIEILTHADAARDALQRGLLLLEDMNENKQRQALRNAYMYALGGTK